MVNSQAKAPVLDNINLNILKEILDEKTVSFKELFDYVSKTYSVTPEELDQRLRSLETVKFVGSSPSDYRDFKTYYLTAEGARKVSQIDSLGLFDAFAIG